MTNGLRYGGAERIVQALATAMSRAGDVVKVVATTRDGPIGEALRADGISTSVLHIGSRIDLRVPLKLAQVARAFEPQVMHSHLAVADIATASAAPLIGRCRTVCTVHNPGVQLDRYKRRLWHAALRRFDVVTAVSERVQASLDARLNPVIVRPSLVDPAAPILARSAARARLGVDPETPLILGVGRLDPIKGFDVLARALPLLRTPNVRTLIIGDGPEAGALAATGLELIGAIDDAAALLGAADVVVCPSRSEGFPQVPIHAMAARRPVVASAVGGTGEIVVDGVTGRLVAAEDPGALAAALDDILGDRATGAAMGDAGHARILAEGLTRSAMIDRVRALYAPLA